MLTVIFPSAAIVNILSAFAINALLVPSLENSTESELKEIVSPLLDPTCRVVLPVAPAGLLAPPPPPDAAGLPKIEPAIRPF